PNEVIKFVMLFEVTTDVQVKKSAPIILELKANECDSYAKRVINILLEPKRTGRQDLDLSLKLLNLEFDDETGKYYLLFEQTLEMSLTVSGYQNNYSCDIKWGDGETTNLKKETESSIIQKHRFTARGTMNIKITVKDVNGRIKTSTILVNVK
ncbi:MAG: PKD domain-containing protein, partial [Caldisericia bacterium]|nr:PKD domain-containing protein [Caldisericia bacterium]